MNRDDALRRIRALRKLTIDEGASPAEAETAARLARQIGERFSIEPGIERFSAEPPSTSSSAAWDYWRWLLSEFHIEARRFCNRAFGKIGTDKQVVINLCTGEWQVQRVFLTGCETIAQKRGLDALRSYLHGNAPRSYSLHA
jgi:hypothetical protein